MIRDIHVSTRAFDGIQTPNDVIKLVSLVGSTLKDGDLLEIIELSTNENETSLVQTRVIFFIPGMDTKGGIRITHWN